MKFSTTVEAVMKSKSLKFADIARMTGYSNQHIRDLIVGKRRWNEDTIKSVCKALGVEVVLIENGGKQHEENCHHTG